VLLIGVEIGDDFVDRIEAVGDLILFMKAALPSARRVPAET
jgi:hypothetical protein